MLTLSKKILLGALSPICASAVLSQSTQPNVVVILADDLGYANISYNGGITPTPNIDKLFANSTRFSNFMTYTVSSPGRAGLITGQNPLRIGQGPLADGNLDPTIMTMGRHFQQNGYKTGLFGKWHNGPSPFEKAGAVQRIGKILINGKIKWQYGCFMVPMTPLCR